MSNKAKFTKLSISLSIYLLSKGTHTSSPRQWAVWRLTTPGTSSVRCSSVEAPTARCDSRGSVQPTHTFELMPKERVVSLRPAFAAARRSQRLPRAPRTRSGTWDTRPPAAAGGRPGSMCWLPEACSSTPQPLRHRRTDVPCRRRPSTLLISPDREGLGWYPL